MAAEYIDDTGSPLAPQLLFCSALALMRVERRADAFERVVGEKRQAEEGGGQAGESILQEVRERAAEVEESFKAVVRVAVEYCRAVGVEGSPAAAVPPECEGVAGLLQQLAAEQGKLESVLEAILRFVGSPVEFPRFVVRAGLERLRETKADVDELCRSGVVTDRGGGGGGVESAVSSPGVLGPLQSVLRVAVEDLEAFLTSLRASELCASRTPTPDDLYAAHGHGGVGGGDGAVQYPAGTAFYSHLSAAQKESLLNVASVKAALALLLECEAAPLSQEWIGTFKRALSSLRSVVDVAGGAGAARAAAAAAAEEEGGETSSPVAHEPGRGIDLLSSSTEGLRPHPPPQQQQQQQQLQPGEHSVSASDLCDGSNEELTAQERNEQTELLKKYAAQRKFMWDARNRLSTFHSFPAETCGSGTNPRRLVEAGFFHAPLPRRPDGVACCGCATWLCSWRPDDVPYEIHIEIDAAAANSCIFLQSGGVEGDEDPEGIFRTGCVPQFSGGWLGLDDGEYVYNRPGYAPVAPRALVVAGDSKPRRATPPCDTPSDLLSRTGHASTALAFSEGKLRYLYTALCSRSGSSPEQGLPVSAAKSMWRDFDSLGCPHPDKDIDKMFAPYEERRYATAILPSTHAHIHTPNRTTHPCLQREQRGAALCGILSYCAAKTKGVTCLIFTPHTLPHVCARRNKLRTHPSPTPVLPRMRTVGCRFTGLHAFPSPLPQPLQACDTPRPRVSLVCSAGAFTIRWTPDETDASVLPHDPDTPCLPFLCKGRHTHARAFFDAPAPLYLALHLRAMLFRMHTVEPSPPLFFRRPRTPDDGYWRACSRGTESWRRRRRRRLRVRRRRDAQRPVPVCGRARTPRTQPDA